jgi:Dolichyl-phosphate-mannose-protein mannosyltransferase
MDTNKETEATVAVASAGLRNRELKVLWIAVLCILILKLIFVTLAVSHLKDEINPLYGIGHADNYYSLAKNVSHGRGLRFDPDTSLTLMREPGYPYFLAVFVHEFEDYNRAAIIANIVLTALTAFLMFNLTRKLTTLAWVAVVGPILYMIHPGVVLAELRSGVEVLYIFLLLIFLSVLRMALSSESTRAYVYAGLVLGVTTLVRSTALLFPGAILLHSFIFRGGWSSLRRSVMQAVLVMACAFLVLTPWILRNYMLVGKFIPTASVQGIAMQVGNYLCTHDDGTKSFEELDRDAAAVRNKLAAQQGYRFKPNYYQYFYDPHDEVTFSNGLGAEVVRQYIQSPSLFFKCTAENVFNFWFQGKNRTSTLGNMAVQSFYLILAGVGLIVGYRRMDKPTLVLLLLFVGYTVAVYAPIHAQARYSLQVMPILAILAAIPICNLMARVFRRRSGGVQSG